MPTLPTLHLVERRRQVCRFAPDEAMFLLEQHRSHLELVPTSRRHFWQVTPAGIAGILLGPRRRIVISPKIPLGNVLFMLDPFSVTDEQPHTAAASGGSIIDLLAAQLARRMLERAAVGLHRAYREQHSQGAFLVGRLDLAAQLRQPAGRKDQLHSRHEDFTCDLPWNQVPQALALLLAGSSLLGDAVRAELARAAAAFACVAEAPLTAALMGQVQTTRTPEEYRSLLDLCLLLVGQMLPGLQAGTFQASLVVSLERLFESYVSKRVENAMVAQAGWEVGIQKTTHPALAEGDAPAMTIRPDVTVDRRGQPVVVVDAKWKKLGESAPSEDLYQVLAYSQLLGARQAVLVYPGRRRVWNYALARSCVQLQVRTLDVSGPISRCRRAGQRLERQVRKMARTRGEE